MSRLLRIGTLSVPAGVANPTVTLPATTQTAASSVATNSNAFAYFRFNRDGTVDKNQGSHATNTTPTTGWTYSHDWCDAPSATVGDNYQIKYALNTGTSVGDDSTITTTFATLSSTLLIGTEATSNHGETNNTIFDVTIEEIGNASNTDTGTYDCQATCV